jgi:hypothetical protein
MSNKLTACLATLIVVPVILLAGCNSGTSQFPDELSEVRDALGYGVAPTYLPDGFEFHSWKVDEPLSAALIYQSSTHLLLVSYPVTLSAGKESPLWENLGLDWQRPKDAVSQVEVDGQEAYLVRGGWSADTLNKLAKLDPGLRDHVPGWDYDSSLSLYFDYELPQGDSVGVRLATRRPAELIVTAEMIKIAESFRSLE